jgi:hypothetical protein
VSGPRAFNTRKEQFTDRAQNSEAEDRSSLARRLNDVPFLRGRTISVELTSLIDQTVDHGLGAPAAFMVIRQNYRNGTKALVTESAPAVQALIDERFQLSVVADINCTVDLWVYPRDSRVIDPLTGQSP